jgi:hypothetical protein
MSKEISDWLYREKINGQLVNAMHERTPDLKEDDCPDWDLGINFDIELLPILDKIMKYLYKLARVYRQDFVIGYYDIKSQISEDISFFGSESGEPKIQETMAVLITGITRCARSPVSWGVSCSRKYD